MTERLGILFLHHHVDAVVENNLKSIRRHNPDAVIATISAGPALPGGYSLADTPALFQLHRSSPTRSSDRLVCSWYSQRREPKCDKWWIAEWDAFCSTSVREYYRPVWEYPFVASIIRLPHTTPNWFWFKKTVGIPTAYDAFVAGAVPFLYLLSEEALSAICASLIKFPMRVANAELRFATAARRCGFAACGFSPPNDHISSVNTSPRIEHPGIYHPIKYFVQTK